MVSGEGVGVEGMEHGAAKRNSRRTAMNVVVVGRVKPCLCAVAASYFGRFLRAAGQG